MANEPRIRSYEDILGEMLGTYMSKIAVNDLQVGSAVSSFFETVALQVFRASAENLSILREFSVDRASGDILKRIQKEERVPEKNARVATSQVTIQDTTFEKISTSVFAASNAPNVGSTTIRVADASLFPNTGQIYIGRGTSNIEGPLSYNGITNQGGFFEITLTQPTTKFHNTSESVILAQGGNRLIQAGSVIKTVASGASPDLRYSITQDATILDGETEVLGVAIAAQEPGADYNVPRNSIRLFDITPFAGAVVRNPSPVFTGRNAESDAEIKDRIKKARISKGLGTRLAIENAANGAQASDEESIVTSTDIFTDGENTTLYIDNGEGYEERTRGVGLETIVDSALGGEKNFQLATSGVQTSVAKAFLESFDGPFSINPNDSLAILVGGVLSEHFFQQDDFRSNGFATPFEVAASINANSNLLFDARVVDNASKLRISAKAESNEFIEVTDPTSGDNAGEALGFPVGESQTLRLFRNNKPISKNGRVARLESADQAEWSNTIISGDNLKISVDNTQTITYNFVNADFIAEGTHTTVSSTNTLQSWVNVINTKVVGITASISGSRLVLSSNIGTSSRGALEIDPTSDLVQKGVFPSNQPLSSSGFEADYQMSRNTAQVRLNSPLEAGESLTAGTEFNRAEVLSGRILGGTINLTSEALLWFLIDEKEFEVVNHGVITDSVVHISAEINNKIRIRSDIEDAFVNVQSGDYVIIWSEELDVNNRVEGRVHAVGTDQVNNDYFEIKLTPSEHASIVAQSPLIFKEGIEFLRTDTVPQKVSIPSGSYDINSVASIIQSQIESASVRVIDDEIFALSTATRDNSGAIFVFGFNASGRSLNFERGGFKESIQSGFAFYESRNKDGDFPLFFHSEVDSNTFDDSGIGSLTSIDTASDIENLSALSFFRHPFLTNGSRILDNQSAGEYTQVKNISGTAVSLRKNKEAKRLREDDRYVLTYPFTFSHNDSIVIVLDNDPVNKTFSIPMFRKALTNETMSVNTSEFRAYDVDSGPTTEFNQFFGNDFNFSDYKVFMRARNVIDPSSSSNEDAILYRSSAWGRSGEKYRIAYNNPTSANNPIQHIVTIGENVDVDIFLKSGDPVGNQIDGTTEWDITVTPNTPVAGVDEVTYTWNNNGTAPAMTGLAASHYVSINQSGEFNQANTGVFRVKLATSNSFTVSREGGIAVAENGIATLTSSTISLYENSATTAQEIVDYVNNSVVDWIDAEIVDDNGSTGAGIISKSTEEDSNFTKEYENLVDGVNWLLESDLSASAPNKQFSFKKSLQLSSFDTNTVNAYTFNSGEEIRFVPTTSKQIVDFISTLAVSGFVTLGNLEGSSKASRVQVSSQVLGSAGAVLVTGGSANNAAAQILGNTSVIPSTDLIRTTISRAAVRGYSSDDWIKIQATNVQNKNINLSVATQVTITPNQPLTTQSIIELDNRNIRERFFGLTRNNPNLVGRGFHVERHGKLTCITWDGQTGADPLFQKQVDINDTSENVTVAVNNGFTEYTATGSRNFSEVNIDDTVTIAGFSDSGNNGTFVVNGISEDRKTISTDNPNGVVATEIIGLGGIEVNTDLKEGDTVYINEPFTSLNQGQFRLIKRFKNSIYIENPSSVEERVVISKDPVDLQYDATTQFDIQIQNGKARLIWNGTGTQPDFSDAKRDFKIELGTNFAIANRGVFSISEVGSNFIEFLNANVTAEVGVTISDVLDVYKPAMVFSEYENTVIGDRFVISGDVLGEDNRGAFSISEVLSDKKVVVNTILDAASEVLQSNLTQVNVEEEKPYSGYKQIDFVSTSASNTNRSVLVLKSKTQFNKINEDSSTTLSHIGKLDFLDRLKTGLDAYKHHTGLLREVNRIVYGDPRDSITYPGVAAAGAEIFIQPPLFKRIVLSVNIRVRTGIPFSRVAEQVRNNLASLINSSPIGESIAISNIIATVNVIPGIKAVSIISPAFNPSNDIILVNPAEKPFIVDIVNDITVSKVEG